MSISTTKVSSRGQVVIPEEIRLALNLREGDRMVVFHHGDSVILKTIEEPSPSELHALLERSRAEAKRLGLKPKDLKRAIKKARQSR